MAVIGKIREKSGLVMIIIGLGMIGFLFQDAATSLLSGGGDNNLGEIGNVEVSGIDFNNKLETSIARWEAQNNRTADSQIRDGLREQVWNELIRDQLLVSQFEELGLAVSPEELDNMITGSDPHPSIKQSFTNPETQVFESAKVLEYLKGLDEMPDAQRNQWLLFEEGIQQERVAAKYNNMLTKGMYATSSMIKRTYNEKNENKNIQYVVKKYAEVVDSTITVTDAELKAYYNEHKNEYERKESRDIEYVRFDVNPSEADILDAKTWITEISEEFKATENDSTFIANNPDEVSYDPSYYSLQDFPANLDSTLFHAEVGTTVGPFEETGKFVFTKLTAIKMVPDSVKARHILLKYTQTAVDTTLRGQLDSVKTVLENGGDFATIASSMSQDAGSAIKGGDLGWFTEGVMVPPFNDACFDGQVGELVIVQSDYGFHLIEIQDQADKTKKVQLARLTKEITPSNDTYDAVFAKASSFYAANGNSEAFTKATETAEFTKLVANDIQVSDKNINGMQNARDLVRWAYNNEKGNVSEPKQFENIFVIAHLSDVKQEGIPPMSEVTNLVEIGAKKDKKASMFIEEMKGILDLNQLSTKIGTQVKNAANVNFAAYSIPGLGQENSLLGAISTIPDGKMTATPIKGKSGVFVVLVESTTPPPATEDYSAIKQELTSKYAGLSSQVLEALKEKYGVVDQRYKFY